MSPSEFDLRAALRDGEGDDAPDVDGLLAHARAHRAQRRTRALSAAAAVVIVAAAGVGGTALWGRSGTSDDTRHGPEVAAGPSPSAGGPAANTPSAAIGVLCPTNAPRPVDPPGRTPTTAPMTRMFAEPVATVVVCAYTGTGATSGSPPSRVTFTGADATSLATSIETASTAKLQVKCPDIATAQTTQLAIIAITSDGTQLPVVTTDVSIPNCNQPITNGTAVRYAWNPPAAVAPRINALSTPTRRSLPTPSGHSGVNGSPVR